MANIVPPKYVRNILVTLQSHGYQAFLVGGCVRDMMMGRHPYDWDICTGALPEQLMEIFPGSLPTGAKHGTVTVRINSRSAEVTTFRSDGNYRDHRHPDMVSFVGDLTTDLSRRDFTMNAMALSPDGLLADPFGGAEDIENRIIRAVGLPQVRFEEDALRMFRAIRFSARLGFEIESETLEAIKIKASLAENVAAERIKAEIEKTLLTDRPEMVLTMMELGLMDKYIISRPEESALSSKIRQLPKKAMYRWAFICVLLKKLGCIESTESFLLTLRCDRRAIRCCRDASEIVLEHPCPQSPVEWKKLLNKYGVDSVSIAAACSDVLYGKGYSKALKAVLKSGECFSLKHLAVTGQDLLELGINGRALGEMLLFLLDYVMEFPDNNRRDLLLSLAQGTEE